jgi:hypothetical protein
VVKQVSTQLRAGRTTKFIFAFGPEMSYIGPVCKHWKIILAEKDKCFTTRTMSCEKQVFSEGAKPIYKLAVGNSSLFYETSELPADEGFLGDEVSVTAAVIWNTISGTRGTKVVLDSSLSFLTAVNTLKVKV